MKLTVVAVAVAALFMLDAVSSQANYRQDDSSVYTWICQEKRCLRKLRSQLNNTVTGTPMHICKLNCDDMGSLWPKPTGPSNLLGKELVSLYPQSISFVSSVDNPEGIKSMLDTAFSIFEGYLTKLLPGNFSQAGEAIENKLQINIRVTDGTTNIGLSTDESYNLEIKESTEGNASTVSANISAATFFGARHALETLSQLIAFDDDLQTLQVVSSALIEDKPVFQHRGVMLDTARNYFSVEKIKKLIDGFSYNKLNRFHWHITDSQAFPMEVKRLPKMMKYGAYGPNKIYTKKDILDVVVYARQRGVKVIPELDQPAHSGYGYQWGAEDGLGDLVVCVESEPWYDFCVQPNCGQLNIVNENVTNVVGDIFLDMMEVFDADIFHMGGDEVDFRCYNSTKSITDWMLANNYTLEREDFFRLWGGFQSQLYQKLVNASKADTQAILWTSGLTDPTRIEKYLDKTKYIIQIWDESKNSIIGGLLQKGYRTIFSNVDAMYLDCGFQAWIGDGHNWCSPIKGWQTVYDNNPEKIYATWVNDSVAAEAVRTGLIVGSEAVLWAEQADDNAVENRIFPRAAAHAERSWTHPSTSHSDAEARMYTNRNRMAARGIASDRLTEEICFQNEGMCHPERSTGGNDDSKNSAGNSVGISIMLFVTTIAWLL